MHDESTTHERDELAENNHERIESLSSAPQIDADVYPTDLINTDQWLTWKSEGGRKPPRAPYVNTWNDRKIDAHDSDNWTDYETARRWVCRLSEHRLGFDITEADPYVFLDYDDVRNPQSGEIHPLARKHLERAASYTEVSYSGSGIHLLVRGELPEGVGDIDHDLPSHPDFPDAGVEVYDEGQYVAMTGDHLTKTPTRTARSQQFLDELISKLASTSTIGHGSAEGPEKTVNEIAAIDSTDKVQDVFDAIEHTTPEDIDLHSNVVEERCDGSSSLDPSWANSQSGTRLAQVDDGWIYRKGMVALDALQVVALEEGIITDETDYPEGRVFWQAVNALRDRGAHIPEYEPRGNGLTEGSDGNSESGLLDYDESLVEVGEAILGDLQNKSLHAFMALIGLLQGDTGGYDELLVDDDKIDRSHQELMALTRLYETIRFVGDEPKERAAEITIATVEAYFREHRTTNEENPRTRKWLQADEEYKLDRIHRAIDDCDRGHYQRFLNRLPNQSRYREGNYSVTGYGSFRCAVDILSGSSPIDPEEDIKEARETIAETYGFDADPDELADILSSSPPTLSLCKVATPSSPGLSGESRPRREGGVADGNYPTRRTVAEVATRLAGDVEHYSERSRRGILSDLVNEFGWVKMAKCPSRQPGEKYVYYSRRLPDPEDAKWIKIEGQKEFKNAVESPAKVSEESL